MQQKALSVCKLGISPKALLQLARELTSVVARGSLQRRDQSALVLNLTESENSSTEVEHAQEGRQQLVCWSATRVTSGK
jgi:hypothetical protein